MNAAIPSSGPANSVRGSPSGSFHLYRHVVFSIVAAIIAPFTGLAWPFAILTGFVVGQDEVDRQRNVPRSIGTSVARVIAITGGVLAMLLLGALIGGLIALPIVALAALSERAAADAEPIDRVVARLLLLFTPVLGYVVLALLGAHVSIHIGA
jgi:hypothetical protein